ncbi:MAG: hypothetical protein JNK29_12575 [Anaerolineales bacterium]|nr:hypothetical protein [Anaerolineales bacterium]
MRCPLCQHEFDETHPACQGRCPMAAVQGCRLICCPNCGYQMVDEKRSGVARLLRLVFPAAAPAPEEAPRP